MKCFLWFIVGAAAGFAIAHQINKTEQGKAFFEDLDSKARDFGAAVADGYHKREAELRGAIDGAADTISDFTSH